MTTLQRPLFRKEAIDFQQHHRQWGDVASATAAVDQDRGLVLWRLQSAVIIVFLFVAQYARKETAIGYLTPTKGTAKIFAPRRGTIKAVHVEQGDTVARRPAASHHRDRSDCGRRHRRERQHAKHAAVAEGAHRGEHQGRGAAHGVRARTPDGARSRPRSGDRSASRVKSNCRRSA